jgi:hypothetical protein
MNRWPQIIRAAYGTATVDLAASGRGFVVTVKPSAWARTKGIRGRWDTFLCLHTALAYAHAHTGTHSAREASEARRRAAAGAAVANKRPNIRPLSPLPPIVQCLGGIEKGGHGECPPSGSQT